MDGEGRILHNPNVIWDTWSLEDVYDAHAVLDMLVEANRPPPSPKRKR